MHKTVVLDGELSLVVSGSAECGVFTALRQAYPVYDGPMEITPTQETQTLDTEMKSVLGDIVVNPIPNNYGLITWNGTTLTVS